MNTEQVALVRASFAHIVPIAEQAAELFYERLFQLDPSLRSLFEGDMAEQGRKLMTTLVVVVRSLNQLDQLLPAVEALGRRHADYGVRVEHYDTVGAALLWTLDQGLGDRFTPEVVAAWTAAYTLLADAMRAAAADVPAFTTPNNHSRYAHVGHISDNRRHTRESIDTTQSPIGSHH